MGTKRRPENKDSVLSMSTLNKLLFNIKNDPYETHNLYNERPDVVKRLFVRIQEHCRKREKFTPVVESESADPALHGGLLLPWLKDGDDLEWHGTEEDKERFLKYNVKV